MASISAALPRVTIQFCTQCKWMLRAAYFAQELLSTFGTALGEVALQPSTGGTFIISLYSTSFLNEGDSQSQHHLLWDRKAEGGFPGIYFSYNSHIHHNIANCLAIRSSWNRFPILAVETRSKESGRKCYLTNSMSVAIGSNIQRLTFIISNIETKELKRRVRDVIEPGRDLGHVDGKKKSIPGIDADAAEYGRLESTANQDESKDRTQRQETEQEQDIRRPRAISNLQTQKQESERKFTPMDVGGTEMIIDGVKVEVKRNPDGSTCEDCG